MRTRDSWRIDQLGVVGWAELSPVSARHVYRGVAEVTIYIAERARDRSVSQALMNALIEASEEELYYFS